MPNWCENELEVSGTKTDIAKFKEQSKGDPMDRDLFVHFVPIPENEKENWHDWCINNWGCKWDASDCELVTDKERLLAYIFNSAWAPPIGWLEKASKLYPNIYFKLRYNEPGMGFRGLATAHNGQLKDKCNQY